MLPPSRLLTANILIIKFVSHDANKVDILDILILSLKENKQAHSLLTLRKVSKKAQCLCDAVTAVSINKEYCPQHDLSEPFLQQFHETFVVFFSVWPFADKFFLFELLGKSCILLHCHGNHQYQFSLEQNARLLVDDFGDC